MLFLLRSFTFILDEIKPLHPYLDATAPALSISPKSSRVSCIRIVIFSNFKKQTLLIYFQQGSLFIMQLYPCVQCFLFSALIMMLMFITNETGRFKGVLQVRFYRCFSTTFCSYNNLDVFLIKDINSSATHAA